MVGLNLSRWLLGSGINGLIVLSFLLTMTILGTVFESVSMLVLGIGFSVLQSLFALIYTTIGAVVLFRSNLACLTDGAPLGVMSLIILVLYWLSLIWNIYRVPTQVARTQSS